MFNKKIVSGALIDTRSERDKLNDYEFKEIVAGYDAPDWREKPQKEWRKFPIFNQDGSGSCVAQTMAKLLGVLYWLKNGIYVHFSATHIYQRRINKPASGMNGVDAFNIAAKGATLEELVPSQNMNDDQMDAVQIPAYKDEVGKIFKIGNFIQPETKNIDVIASIIQKTGKAVMLWFYFKADEWASQPIIKYTNLDLRGSGTIRHSVAAVDYCLINGKKALIIEDSWGTSYGMAGQRIIDEDFFNERNFFACYPMNFAFENLSGNSWQKHTFNNVLEIGSGKNIVADVRALQNVLKYEGFFPINTESTGYYGAITAKGVLAFQKKYQIADPSEIELLQGRRVGEKTLAKLNELYSQ